MHKTAPLLYGRLIGSSGKGSGRTSGEAERMEVGAIGADRKDKEDKKEEGNRRDGNSKGGEGSTRPLSCCQVNAIWVFYR